MASKNMQPNFFGYLFFGLFQPLLSLARMSVAVAALILVTACSPRSEIISGLEESEANQIIEVLAAHDISGVKSSSKTGFTIMVPSDTFALSLMLMKQAGLPRKAHQNLGELFQKSGMVSSPVEEKARYLFAISQELESTISAIDGVLLARVHPVMPERITPGEPPIPASCSVLIKYNSKFDVPVYRDRIANIVTNAIPGLANSPPTAISIVFIPSESNLIYSSNKVADLKEMSKNISSEVGQSAPWYLYVLVIGSGLACFVLMGFGLYYNSSGKNKDKSQKSRSALSILGKKSKKEANSDSSEDNPDFQDTVIEESPR